MQNKSRPVAIWRIPPLSDYNGRCVCVCVHLIDFELGSFCLTNVPVPNRHRSGTALAGVLPRTQGSAVEYDIFLWAVLIKAQRSNTGDSAAVRGLFRLATFPTGRGMFHNGNMYCILMGGGECRITQCKGSLGQSSYTFMAIKHWNNLATELITTAHFLTFSHPTKQWIFTQQIHICKFVYLLGRGWGWLCLYTLIEYHSTFHTI